MARKNETTSLQGRLMLPLLEALEEAGNGAKTSEVYQATARRLGLSAATRAQSTKVNGRNVNEFERAVRWTQQRARLAGLAERPAKDRWRLTGKGARLLTEAEPGHIVTIWTTERGTAIWADCADAVRLIERSSVDLILTSPPYPLTSPKPYGGYTSSHEQAYIDWLLRLTDAWGETMSERSSLVLNMGDAWLRGHPQLSIYQERLICALHDKAGWSLNQRFHWFNPAAMPGPAAYTNVRRIRVKQAVENVWWLSRSDDPYADNTQVLRPYSEQMKAAIRAGGQNAASRPSGYSLRDAAFSNENSGSIPPNIIIAANTASNDAYTTSCKAAGLPIHPARSPKAVPDFMIRLLTKELDLVWDPFGGSGTVAEAAERLNRRWITTERIREYVEGAMFRIPSARPAQAAG